MPSRDWRSLSEQVVSTWGRNPWFHDQLWPENRDRILWMLSRLEKGFEGGEIQQVLDIGCYPGLVSRILAKAGIDVIAFDSEEAFVDIGETLTEAGIAHRSASLNDLDTLPDIGSNTIDGIVFGEVFEHLLHHPLGVLNGFYRVLKPGGVMVLTTPNPSTVMNVVRLLLDRPLLRGGAEFSRLPKWDGTS